MICPYNHMQIQQVYQDVYEYDEDSKQTMHQNVLTETRQYGKCSGEECAVWYDNRCHYNGNDEQQ